MKVAVIADIHANQAALKAVLADAKKQEVDEVWCLGDYLGYGPDPNGVSAIAAEYPFQSIIGNYDLNVLSFPSWRRDKGARKHPSKFFLFDWTYRSISSRTKVFLRRLPRRRVLTLGPFRCLLVHGSPAGIADPLFPDTPEKRFRELAQKVRQEIVLCGHTHRFFRQQVGPVTFINPGSVGRPFDGDVRASYALLEVKGRQLAVRNRRVRYTVRATLRKMRSAGFPDDVVSSIAGGLSLDEVHSREDRRRETEWRLAAVAYAKTCRYERQHSHQVTRLALRFFDDLAALHRLGRKERSWLEAAGLLHDIGWVKGRKGHHKTSRDMILKAAGLPWDPRSRLMIALIARYHRRSLPQPDHQYYRDLSTEDRRLVRVLASFLRVADGLDRMHISNVRDLACCVSVRQLTVTLKVGRVSPEEIRAARQKSDLFRQVFSRKVLLRCVRELSR